MVKEEVSNKKTKEGNREQEGRKRKKRTNT